MPTPARRTYRSLIAEMAERTDSGYVFGGLASSRSGTLQFALSGHGNVKGQAAGGVFSGGLSGVAWPRRDADVAHHPGLPAGVGGP